MHMLVILELTTNFSCKEVHWPFNLLLQFLGKGHSHVSTIGCRAAFHAYLWSQVSICLLFASPTNCAFAATWKDKGFGHRGPSFLPAPSAREETMTQKTNGPVSLTMVMISPLVISLFNLENWVQRKELPWGTSTKDKLNSQTHIRTVLSSVHDTQAAKVMKVERTKEFKTELFFFSPLDENMMVWEEPMMCPHTSLEQRNCHSKYRDHLYSVAVKHASLNVFSPYNRPEKET